MALIIFFIILYLIISITLNFIYFQMIVD